MKVSKKRVRREFWWLENWQLEEQEAWLQEMSAEGWHLLKTEIGRATFEQGEPQNYRYRCDVFPAGNWSEQERLALYQEAGWEHVALRGLVQIFRAPAEQSIPEIHTEPREHLRNVRRLLPERIVSSLVALLFTIGLTLLYKFRTAEALLSTDWLIMIINLFALGWVLLSFGALQQVLRYMQRVRRRVPPTQPLDWRRQKRRRQVSGALLALVFILVCGNKIAAMVSNTPGFPPIPDHSLPALRLVQVLDTDQYANASPYTGFYEGKGDVFNYYRQKSSLLIPEQHYLSEGIKLTDAKESERTIMFLADSYRAKLPTIAKLLATSMAQRRPRTVFRSSEALPPAGDKHGFDGLWVLDTSEQKDVVAWQGDWVYYISYSGTGSLEQIINTLRESQGR